MIGNWFRNRKIWVRLVLTIWAMLVLLLSSMIVWTYVEQKNSAETQAKEFAADAIDRTETALIYAFRDLPTGYRSFVVAGDRVVWLRLNRDMLPVCVTHGPRSLPVTAGPRPARRGA